MHEGCLVHLGRRLALCGQQCRTMGSTQNIQRENKSCQFTDKKTGREMCYKRLLNPCPSVSFLLHPAPFHLPVWFDTGRSSLAFVPSESKGMRRSTLQIQSQSAVPLKQSFGFLHIHLLPSWQCLILTSCHFQCFL